MANFCRAGREALLLPPLLLALLLAGPTGLGPEWEAGGRRDAEAEAAKPAAAAVDAAAVASLADWREGEAKARGRGMTSREEMGPAVKEVKGEREGEEKGWGRESESERVSERERDVCLCVCTVCGFVQDEQVR